MYSYIKQLRWAQLKVGVVITIALFIALFTILFAGNIEKLFIPKVTVYAMFQDVKGLRSGAPVWFSGVEIGSVSSIDFLSDRNLKVTMSVKHDSLKFLRKDSGAQVNTFGLLGDKYIEISPGTREMEALGPGDTIQGVSRLEIQDIVHTSQESIERISEFVNMLEEMLSKIDRGEGTVAKFLKDPDLYNNLKETTRGLSDVVDRLEEGRGSMGRLLKDEALYADISSSAQDIKLFAENLKASEGTLNRVINDPALYERFLRASESLDLFTQKVNTSRGTLNRLIEDESLYANLNKVSERLGLILDRIDRGEGVVGKLVQDDELSDELVTTLKELNALVKDIKEHPTKYFKFSLF
jgi:phospholipid/cholesterol/gamma-HCH transport system substrate-binding protein